MTEMSIRDNLTINLYTKSSVKHTLFVNVRFVPFHDGLFYWNKKKEDHFQSSFSIPIFYNGIFPCFLGGLVFRLFCVISNACISLKRVWRGKITSSIYPCSAALYGLANVSR